MTDIRKDAAERGANIHISIIAPNTFELCESIVQPTCMHLA